jgi:hypothetical protein
MIQGDAVAVRSWLCHEWMVTAVLAQLDVA